MRTNSLQEFRKKQYYFLVFNPTCEVAGTLSG